MNIRMNITKSLPILEMIEGERDQGHDLNPFTKKITKSMKTIDIIEEEAEDAMKIGKEDHTIDVVVTIEGTMIDEETTIKKTRGLTMMN